MEAERAKRGRRPAPRAKSAAERTANRKARLKEKGLVETKTLVPASAVGLVHELAAALVAGAVSTAQLRRLLPKPAEMPDPRQVTLYEAIETAKTRLEGGENA